MTTRNALHSAFPVLADSLPSIAFAVLPTPLDDAASLGAALGIGGLRIKRDDLTSPVYGGNKVRKLEYLLADACEQGCDAVVTYGAAGSNHALATSIFAKQLGLQCHALLMAQLPGPRLEATLRYHRHIGTKLHPIHRYEDAASQLQSIRDSHPGGPDRVYEIPWGGSSWLGAVGFVAAGLELSAQLDAAGLKAPEFIYIPCGTMGTVVGLAIGLHLAGRRSRIVAARVVPPAVASAERMDKFFSEVHRELRARDASFPMLDEPMANIELRDEVLGDGYGISTPEAAEAVALFAEHTGLKLEMTYTGKALAALAADARSGRLAGRSALFWNTYNSAPYPAALAGITLADLPAGLFQPAKQEGL